MRVNRKTKIEIAPRTEARTDIPRRTGWCWPISGTRAHIPAGAVPVSVSAKAPLAPKNRANRDTPTGLGQK
jgi:hypothetical protein